MTLQGRGSSPARGLCQVLLISRLPHLPSFLFIFSDLPKKFLLVKFRDGGSLNSRGDKKKFTDFASIRRSRQSLGGEFEFVEQIFTGHNIKYTSTTYLNFLSNVLQSNILDVWVRRWFSSIGRCWLRPLWVSRNQRGEQKLQAEGDHVDTKKTRSLYIFRGRSSGKRPSQHCPFFVACLV